MFELGIFRGLLSILRRISFLLFLTLLTIKFVLKIDVGHYYNLSIFIYLGILLISFVYHRCTWKSKKKRKMLANLESDGRDTSSFILYILTDDLSYPLLNHGGKYDRTGLVICGYWMFRNYKENSKKQKFKIFILRIIIYTIIILIFFATVLAFFK